MGAQDARHGVREHRDPPAGVTGALERAYRDERPAVLAAITRRLDGDLALAEDVVQDAVEQALRRWPDDGLPRSPGAWLTTVARNRALDLLRRRQTERAKLQEVAMNEPADSGDDLLRLIFTCCHPALALESRVALTLKTIVGLSTAEIARSFLVSEATMSQRLLRTKRKITQAGIPYRVPADDVLGERVGGVLVVIYLIFNEGYGGRDDLADEAIRLGRMLATLMPDEPEALGLLALMLCHHARSAARHADGEIVLLGQQDRGRWDSELIAESRALLDQAIARARGPYVVQAAIAVLHTEPEIDWAQVVALYLELARLTGSPVVELNRAVAVAQAGAPQAALRITESLDLDNYPYLHSTRAELLRRLDRADEAIAAYRRALELLTAEPERRFVRRRIAELEQR